MKVILSGMLPLTIFSYYINYNFIIDNCVYEYFIQIQNYTVYHN